MGIEDGWNNRHPGADTTLATLETIGQSRKSTKDGIRYHFQ